MEQNGIIKTSLSEQLSDILSELIMNGTYKSGDKLPSENELTELYDVSRLTVRSALQRLNALGLVSTKAGSGTYVNEFKLDNYLINTSPMFENPKTLDDIKAFRKLVDIECIRLAIENASDEDMNELIDACNQHLKIYFENEVIDDNFFLSHAESDFNVHMTIVKLSGNSMYSLIYQTAKDLLIEYLYTIANIRYKRTLELENYGKFYETVVKSHQALYDAIVERDFAKAKKYYLNHIDYSVLHLLPEDFD